MVMINGSRYDFVKIDNLLWEEILTYARESTHKHSVKVLGERLSGADVYVDKILTGYKIRIRFHSEADEAEFILRESTWL